MGGSVAVCLRYEDGKTITLDTWTNPMPYWFKNQKVYIKDKAHLDKYIQENLDNQSEEVPLAPLGYGLVVIDYKTNHILTHQGYCNFDNFISATFSLRHGDDEFNADIGELIVAGRLRLRTTRNVWKNHELISHDDHVYYDVTMENFQERLKQARWFDGDQRRWNGDNRKYNMRIDVVDGKDVLVEEPTTDDVWYNPLFVVDTAPFTILDYQFSTNLRQRQEGGSRAMKAKLEELGFEISAEAEKIWADFIRDEEEDY